MTRDVLPAGLTAAEIDAAVKERTLAGESIYALDTDLLRDLRPDLIVTQALCSVCAVSYDEVRAIAAADRHAAAGDRARSAHGRRGARDARTIAQATGARTPRSSSCARPRRGSTGSASRSAAHAGRASSRSSGWTRRSPPATGSRS